MIFQFELALLPDGWATDVLLEADNHSGKILRIEKQVTGFDRGSRKVLGAAVPGFINAHSHAFQRAFTGLSEYQTQTGDSFWTWRKMMYEFLESLTPSDVYQIAKQLYSDMLAAGYTSVCEFQYVHNDPSGEPYADIAEMSNSLVQAAVDAGVAINILPVLYQRGGFREQELVGGQKRFGLRGDQFVELLSCLQSRWGQTPGVNVGMAFHSLRAVGMPNIRRIAEEVQSSHPAIPIHIHIAEQTQEVDECLDTHRLRPVQFLIENVNVDDKWCLIHATHLSSDECSSIARSGATVCVCPTTEANLGDGLFSAEDFLLKHAGHLAIGSDSNTALNPFSELRLLEYGQRLFKRQRAVLCTASHSVGRFLCQKSWQGGALVSGLPVGALDVGKRADITILEVDSAIKQQAINEPDRILDFCMFNENRHSVVATVSGGRLIEHNNASNRLPKSGGKPNEATN